MSPKSKKFVRFVSWVLCKQQNEESKPTHRNSHLLDIPIRKEDAQLGGNGHAAKRTVSVISTDNADVEVKHENTDIMEEDPQTWQEAAKQLDRFFRLIVLVFNLAVIILDVILYYSFLAKFR